MALDSIYCVCPNPSEYSRFIIKCHNCKNSFHGRCVGVREYQVFDIVRFSCPRCEPYHGPSVLKTRSNYHRHDYSEADATNKAVQTGTQVFIKELERRHFHSGDKVIKRLQGCQLNLDYIASSDAGGEEDTPGMGSFTQPILVTDKTGLDLTVPHPTFSVNDVENYVGSHHEVDVVDVQRQQDVKMRLHEFVEYFQSPVRSTVLNLISLEFSRTNLSQLVEPPMIVRKMCWVHAAWPSDPPAPPPLQRPTVSKYCLIGVENSFTDFHIDFGGSSVWYHVLWGEKIFYLIKPTPANLSLYQNWLKAANKSEMFFGDNVDACYKCEVKAGETLFLPSGWIHAVFTPIDTMVFGGNFLHSYNIEMQLKIYEMEVSMCIGKKWQYPHFRETSWYAARNLLDVLRNSQSSPPALLHGLRVLYNSLRQWLYQGGRGATAVAGVPEGLNAPKLLKELQRELRSTEKQVGALNPPRPERESKRRKKKQLADDFVDYTNLTSFHTALEARLTKREPEDYDSDSPEEKPVSMEVDSTEPTLQVERLQPKFELTEEKYLVADDGQFLERDSPPQHLLTDSLKAGSEEQSLVPERQGSYPSYQLLSSAEFITSSPGATDYASSYHSEYPADVKVDPLNSSVLTVNGAPETAITLPGGHTVLYRPQLYTTAPEAPEDRAEEDDDDTAGSLMIDESPVSKRRASRLKIAYDAAGADESLVYGTGAYVEVAGNVEVSSAPTNKAHHNGIEELLRASAYAPADYGGAGVIQHCAPNTALLVVSTAHGGSGLPGMASGMLSGYAVQPPQQHIAAYTTIEGIHGSGRASPSTRDAIDGMLSMSGDTHYSLLPDRSRRPQQQQQVLSVAGRAAQQQRSRQGTMLPGRHKPRHYIEEESIKKVHQDDDYVYPTLDHSDDEDYPIFKPRGKKKEDEAWNPKARVRVAGPRPVRPARLGAKKQAVEKGLEVAANRRNTQPAAKRAYHRKKTRSETLAPVSLPGPVPAVLSSPRPGLSSAPSSFSNSFHHPSTSTHTLKPSTAAHTSHHRPKKGMATAKQRLGKILKIHKMIY